MNFHYVCLMCQLVKGELHHTESCLHVITVRTIGRYLEIR